MVSPGLLDRHDGAHYHEHGAEHNDGLVEGDLRQKPAVRAQALQEADVEDRRDDVVCAGSWDCIILHHKTGVCTTV